MSMPASARMRGKQTQPPCGRTHSRRGSAAIQVATVSMPILRSAATLASHCALWPKRDFGDLFVDDAAADADLLFRGEEALHQLRIAVDDPADAHAGDAVGFRNGRDADGAGAEAGGDGEFRDEGHLAIGLVDQQADAARLCDRDQAAKRGFRERDAGRVVRRRHGDEFRVGADQAFQAIDVELEACLETEVHIVDVAADGARGFDVRGVVRAHDDEMIAFFKQRRGDDEESGGSARGAQHVRVRDFGVGSRSG